MSRTRSGISIHRSVDTSWPMMAIGKIGVRSGGVSGSRVRGLRNGPSGSGRSATMLYQRSGSSSSLRRNLVGILSSSASPVGHCSGGYAPRRHRLEVRMAAKAETQQMRAVRFGEYGPATNLVVADMDRPEPKEGEVLVRVRATGVNAIDWKLRAGHLQAYMPVELPHTPGFDLAGTVDQVGAGVS